MGQGGVGQGGQRQKWKGREKMTEHQFSIFSVLLKVTFASHVGILLCLFLKGLIFLYFPYSSGVTFIWHESFDKSKMWWQSLCFSSMCAAHAASFWCPGCFDWPIQMPTGSCNIKLYSKVVNQVKTSEEKTFYPKEHVHTPCAGVQWGKCMRLVDLLALNVFQMLLFRKKNGGS